MVDWLWLVERWSHHVQPDFRWTSAGRIDPPSCPILYSLRSFIEPCVSLDEPAESCCFVRKGGRVAGVRISLVESAGHDPIGRRFAVPANDPRCERDLRVSSQRGARADREPSAVYADVPTVRAKWSTRRGHSLKGRFELTMPRGTMIVRDREVARKPGNGKYISGNLQ
jgi:hypothetical protein